MAIKMGLYGGAMLRVVIDTDVLLSAFLSPDGASRQLLLDALDGMFQVLLSTGLLIEYESTLRRPSHLNRARATVDDVTEVLDALAGLCVPVALDFIWRPTGSHADDELVVETAVKGHADIVATFNIRHIRDAAARFGFQALRPGPVIERIRQ